MKIKEEIYVVIFTQREVQKLNLCLLILHTFIITHWGKGMSESSITENSAGVETSRTTRRTLVSQYAE